MPAQKGMAGVDKIMEDLERAAKRISKLPDMVAAEITEISFHVLECFRKSFHAHMTLYPNRIYDLLYVSCYIIWSGA